MNRDQQKEAVDCFYTADGLRVNLIQRPGYEQTVAALSVAMGSLSTSYEDDRGQKQAVPAGTAHFLEHKLFDKPSGDVLIDFTNLGADANAFTTMDQTCYYFSTNQSVEKALDLLLHFVQEPYFTEETVARERGIIEEEIASYQDDPFSILYQGVLKTAFEKSPLADDIAGTPASLKEITAELLYQVHARFYQPANLSLTVVSGKEPDQLRDWIVKSQARLGLKKGAVPAGVQLSLPQDQRRQGSTKAAVQREKLALLKRLPLVDGRPFTEQRLLAEIALDLTFGEQTDWYQKQYQEGRLGDDFDYEVQVLDGVAFLLFFSSADDVSNQAELIEKRLANLIAIVQEAGGDFDLLKRALIGENSMQQDRLEQLALDDDLALYGLSLFDKMKILARFEHGDVIAYAKTALQPGPLTQFTLKKLR